MKKIILHTIFLLSCVQLYAQYWTQQHYNVENGLPDNYTFAIEKFQDELYIATDGGLTTFDGVDFKIHHRKEVRYPVCLVNKNDSILYISSWLDGIIAKQKQEFTNVYAERVNRALQYQDKVLFYNVYQRNAFLTFNKEYVVDTLVSENYTNRNRRIAIDIDAIYIAEGQTIKTYDWNGNQQTPFPYQPTAPVEAIRSINSLLFFGDQHGNLTWISKKNPEQKQSYHFKNSYTIQHIEPYKKQQIIVQFKHRAEYSSLCIVTFSDDFSKIVNTECILTIKYGISDIFVDDNIIYVASYGNGIYKLFPSLFKSYQKNDYQIPVPKFCYENDAGNMVFATENVSYTLQEDNTFTPQKNKFRLNTIFEFQNERYFSSHEGLYNSKLEEISGCRANNFLYAAEKDTIFYSKYWLSRFHRGEREDLFCIQYNRKAKKINTGIFTNNTIHIGTQAGIRKFSKSGADTWAEEIDTVLQQTFAQRVVRKLLKHKNQIIITTPYEAFTYKENAVSTLQFTDKNIYINDTFVDSDDRIYIASNKGLWILTDDFTYHFNTKNGTNSDNIYSFYQDSKGIVWITTGNGIMEFNPQRLQVMEAPKIDIHQTTIKDDQVHIQFKNSTQYFAEDVLFEYNINNSEWRKRNLQQLHMSNLKPGTYSVSFRGKHLNSNWSAPVTTTFTIAPKWYQLTVIKIFIFIVIVLLLLGFLWFRLRVIKRRNAILSNEIDRRIFLEHKVEHLREEVARDFHDEIGNKIASVIGLSNNLKHSEKITSPKVDKITSLSKEIYHTAKDFVWSLNPKNNNIESLCKYLRDYGENFFDLFDEIDFLYQEIDIFPIDISYTKSRNIILAYKEILANIIKHSQATKVTFKAYLYENTFTIQIQDNGIGIEAAISDNGNGLKNIQKRMEMIDAEMSIEKSDGVCYTFVLDVEEELIKYIES
ncbi:sensor histidine kinase [Kordia periserrulae]|uniref:sensor histidine kinase n=1 Tax=Kordia periserrulae TaxID=701523 RepID=UPI000D343036|nr:ATP-binding protein [Kordia periserrulae]